MTITKSTILNPQVCKIELVTSDKVSAVVSGTSPMQRLVGLVGGAAWSSIYFTQGSAIFSEEQQEDVAGPYFMQKLEFLFPGEDADSRAKLLDFETMRMLVKLTFNSGILKLMGDIENPCVIKSVFSIEKGGHIITINHKSTSPAFYL